MIVTSVRDDALLEKAAIRETLLRYAAGIDRRDWDLMLSCFTEDVWAIFQGNDLGRGRDKILAYINTAAFSGAINELKADGVFVAMSAPNSEKAWVYTINYSI